ncbi:hypothetical protein ACRQ5Q_35970 [Bradyrhizobium sp. PMVTL-01]|uniref:hypothetical protein n=1 Tax=Bradyrhizobium sp. PMVTL-01 TaxID=3434999 RepID=UPI003F71003D
MKFMLVNDEPLSRDSSCTGCARRLRSGHVRHVHSHARFCDEECLRRHQVATAFARWPVFDFKVESAPNGIAASQRSAVESVAVLNAVEYWRHARQMWTLSLSMIGTFLSANELMTSKGGDS